MYGYDEIYALLATQLGVDRARLTPDISLLDDLGVDGDDFFELAEAFARRFNVGMSTYRWYFHHSSEGSSFNIGGMFFTPPYDLVGQIPVTPKMLLESANAGRWLVEYPPHDLPRRRYDIIINQVLGSIIVLLLLSVLFYALTR